MCLFFGEDLGQISRYKGMPAMERSRVAFDSVVMRVYLGCVEHPVWMGPRVGRENVCVFVCVVSGPEICADILGTAGGAHS